VVVSRAAFLRVIGLASLGMGLEPRVLVAAAPAPLDADRFRPLVGDAFSLAAESGPTLPVTLVKIVERPIANHVEQFMLLFHGPAGEPVADGIHQVDHPALGSLAMFMTSSAAPGDDRRAFQACFTRHVRG
jgi:hypothetical protein